MLGVRKMSAHLLRNLVFLLVAPRLPQEAIACDLLIRRTILSLEFHLFKVRRRFSYRTRGTWLVK